VPDVIAYWIKELRATRNNVHGLAVGPTFHLDASAMWLSS
jgi:myo-inositol catabolism protein IolC